MSIVVQRLDAPTVRKTTGSGFSPLIRCRECGREVARPETGRVAWDAEENATRLTVSFLHERCVEAHLSSAAGRIRVARLSRFLRSLERFAADGPDTARG